MVGGDEGGGDEGGGAGLEPDKPPTTKHGRARTKVKQGVGPAEGLVQGWAVAAAARFILGGKCQSGVERAVSGSGQWVAAGGAACGHCAVAVYHSRPGYEARTDTLQSAVRGRVL